MTSESSVADVEAKLVCARNEVVCVFLSVRETACLHVYISMQLFTCVNTYNQVTRLESLLHAMRASEARNRENLTQQPQEEQVRSIRGSSMRKPGVKPYHMERIKKCVTWHPNHCCAGMQVVLAHTCISESISTSAAVRRGREHGGLGEGGGGRGSAWLERKWRCFRDRIQRQWYGHCVLIHSAEIRCNIPQYNLP